MSGRVCLHISLEHHRMASVPATTLFVAAYVSLTQTVLLYLYV